MLMTRKYGKDDILQKIQEGKVKGHTHIQVSPCHFWEFPEMERFLQDNPNWYCSELKTGFPVYSNYNRYVYEPVITRLTGSQNYSKEKGFARFLNS